MGIHVKHTTTIHVTYTTCRYTVWLFINVSDALNLYMYITHEQHVIVQIHNKLNVNTHIIIHVMLMGVFLKFKIPISEPPQIPTTYNLVWILKYYIKNQ